MTAVEHHHYPKGLEVRDRIVRAAAQVVLERGVQGTTQGAVRQAASVSGGQLSHYFPDKEALIAAVVDWRAQAISDFTELAAEGGLDTFDGLKAWVNSYLDREDSCIAGCSFGSIAGEIMKTELALRPRLAAGFDQWIELFRAGLRAMRDRGDIVAEADPDALADVLMTAFQGGMLLSQASGEPTQLRHALIGALDYLSRFRT